MTATPTVLSLSPAPSVPPGYHGGYVDPHWPDPNGPNDAWIIIYGYKPSVGLAICGLVMFALLFIVHIVQILRWRTWFFIPVVLGTAFEVVGYIFRTLSAKVDPYNIIYFVIQYFFIVVAPVLVSASIYTILYKLITRLDAQLPSSANINVTQAVPLRSVSPIPPRLVLWFFISLDAFATVIQILGSAQIGAKESKHKSPNTWNDVLLAGLCIQVASFVAFLVLTGVVGWRARAILFGGSAHAPRNNAADRATALRQDEKVDMADERVDEESNMRRRAGDSQSRISRSFLVSTTIAALAILLRTSYRTSETAQHSYGSTAKGVTEGKYAGLEFVPVVVAVLLLAVWHPGRCLPRR